VKTSGWLSSLYFLYCCSNHVVVVMTVAPVAQVLDPAYHCKNFTLRQRKWRKAIEIVNYNFESVFSSFKCCIYTVLVLCLHERFIHMGTRTSTESAACWLQTVTNTNSQEYYQTLSIDEQVRFSPGITQVIWQSFISWFPVLVLSQITTWLRSKLSENLADIFSIALTANSRHNKQSTSWGSHDQLEVI
jgi:hypothetical protein